MNLKSLTLCFLFLCCRNMNYFSKDYHILISRESIKRIIFTVRNCLKGAALRMKKNVYLDVLTFILFHVSFADFSLTA